MTDSNTTGSTPCPVCSEGVSVPAWLSYRSGLRTVVNIDLGPVREHLATHQAPPLITELPQTAR